MRIVLFFILAIFFSACVAKDKVPEGIIPQNEMRKLMWDMMRADAFVSDFVMKDTARNQKTESAILYEKIFSIHSTTEEVFKKSLTFYQSRPDLLKVITDSLKADQRKAQEYQAPENAIQTDTTSPKIKFNKRLIKTKQ